MKTMQNKKSIIFSFILLFGNDADYVEKCFNSLLKQKFKNFEILCLNLASSDKTSEIIAEYSAKYPDIILKKEKFDNINKACNFGLLKSRGKYVKFINARSVFYKFTAELLLNVMDHENTNIIVHPQAYFYGNNLVKNSGWDWMKEHISPVSTNDVIKYCFQADNLEDCVAFNREFAVFNEIIFDEKMQIFDISELYRLMFVAGKMSFIFQDIVQNIFPKNEFVFSRDSYFHDLRIIKNNLAKLVNLYGTEIIKKGCFLEWIISFYSRLLKFSSKDFRQKIYKNVLTDIDNEIKSKECLNNLSLLNRFNYGAIISGFATNLKISIIYECEEVNQAARQYINNYCRSADLTTELIIYAKKQNDDNYVDKICEQTDFIKIKYKEFSFADIDNIRGEYVVFANENNIFADDLNKVYVYADEIETDILFAIAEYGAFEKVMPVEIFQEYIKYPLQKYSFQNIYANRLINLLYYDSAIIYRREYLQNLKNNYKGNVNTYLLPLVAVLNSPFISIYENLVNTCKNEELSSLQVEKIYNTYKNIVGIDFKEAEKYDELLYRFRVASEDGFVRKLEILQKQHSHLLEKCKKKYDEKQQYLIDRADVAASSLWDEKYYLSQFNFSAYNINVSPIDHYLSEGWKKGFSPSKYFNGPQYAKQYDIEDKNPLVFFLQQGRFKYRGFPINTYPYSEQNIKNYWKHKKRNKKVIYMCITGDYDKIEEIKAHSYINPEWDYVCFTDNKEHLKQKVVGIWQMKKLQYTKSDNTRNNRWHKVFPHLLFPEYDESIYMDSNINVLSPYLFEEIERRNSDLLLPKHAGNFSIYHEFRWALASKVDKPELIMRECEEIMNTGFPFFYGMPECNIIYRRHSSKVVRSIMDDWWYWIITYAKRDQLSFSYLLWKYNITVEQCTFVNARIAYDDFCVFLHPVDRKI